MVNLIFMLMSSAPLGIPGLFISLFRQRRLFSVLGVDQSQTNISSHFDLYHHHEHHLHRCPLITLRDFTSMHRTFVQVRS
jgi:hypothetical protein